MSRTYMVQISLQNSGGKVVFSEGVPWKPPLGTNGSKNTLVTKVLSTDYYEHSKAFQILQYIRHMQNVWVFCLNDTERPR